MIITYNDGDDDKKARNASSQVWVKCSIAFDQSIVWIKGSSFALLRREKKTCSFDWCTDSIVQRVHESFWSFDWWWMTGWGFLSSSIDFKLTGCVKQKDIRSTAINNNGSQVWPKHTTIATQWPRCSLELKSKKSHRHNIYKYKCNDCNCASDIIAGARSSIHLLAPFCVHLIKTAVIRIEWWRGAYIHPFNSARWCSIQWWIL